MPGYLIMPVQRVPRYALLIKEILKFTPNGHKDRIYLEDALTELGRATTHIDDTINQRKNYEQIIELQSLFVEEIHLTAPGRMLLKEGQLKRITRRGNIIGYTFHLFSDTLIYSETTIGGKLKLHNAIDLSQSSIQSMSEEYAMELGVPVEFAKCAMKVFNASKSFIIYADTEKLKNEWLELISTSIAKLTASNTSIDARKMWDPNDSSTKCILCSTEFTMLYRRHHCRKCGALVCNSCSSGRMSIDSNSKPERVCYFICSCCL
jgi:FYVE/RhoGEF/PH domain-containing protein 5/6